jgi:hypothetical protein
MEREKALPFAGSPTSSVCFGSVLLELRAEPRLGVDPGRFADG